MNRREASLILELPYVPPRLNSRYFYMGPALTIEFSLPIVSAD